MKFLPTLPLRATLLPLLLLGLLSSCAVYDTVFHPHRLPTPKMDATAKAKHRAAEKARHKGLSLKAPEPSTNATDTDGGDPAAPGAASGSTDDKKKTLTYGELPEGTRIKYDKQGLVKKSMLDRMANNGHKLHHYDTRPLTPREASRENRKVRKKGHTDHGKDAAPRDKAPREPLDPALDTGPDPGAPTTTPNSPAEEPAKAKKKAPRSAPVRPAAPKKKVPKPASAPEPTKAKKTADKKAPKPDPTQPAPAPEPAKAKKKASKVPIPKPDPTQPAPK